MAKRTEDNSNKLQKLVSEHMVLDQTLKKLEKADSFRGTGESCKETACAQGILWKHGHC